MSAASFSLARRMTEKNEPDMLQESFVQLSEGNYSEQVCQQLVKKVTPMNPLPSECQKFPNVLKSLKRRDSNKSDHAKAFQGMSPHEMAAAMAARERGHLNHAQIQRRLTTSHRR
mmetsp:Transcript_8987/g.16303  ORF Transcript_8987/g.16303 Transcript_8987/m.16303 type:complete len:115 (+) Transcript_8987:79-423(+)